MPPPTATRTRKKVPSSSENSRRPSYLSFKKSNSPATEFGCPMDRKATWAWRAISGGLGSCGGAGSSGWLVILHPFVLLFIGVSGCHLASAIHQYEDSPAKVL